MRLIVLLLFWLALFGLLLRILPQVWGIPLYVLFLAIALLYLARERRHIAARRRSLQDELEENRRQLRQTLREKREISGWEEE
ncbi:MAG TPA: hypothetical protein VK879_01130 [Candidatus Sulfomarinibacteraceae bacterium]|nr:hypothetical protein [Candidatus Sulfomarinibacteraceae bacterium]